MKDTHLAVLHGDLFGVLAGAYDLVIIEGTEFAADGRRRVPRPAFLVARCVIPPREVVLTVQGPLQDPGGRSWRVRSLHYHILHLVDLQAHDTETSGRGGVARVFRTREEFSPCLLARRTLFPVY